MLLLVALFAGWVDGQTALLGADRYDVREWAEASLDYPLAALFLPDCSADPEINHRLRRLRTRNLRWFRLAHVERMALRGDARAWVRLCLLPGRSVIAREYDTFTTLHAEYDLATAVFAKWPPQPGESRGFLWGSIYPGEYDRYLAFIDYHTSRAPMPREPVSP